MDPTMKRKGVLAAFFIFILLSSGIPHHTHSILTSHSRQGLLKFIFYISILLFGIWYIWRRLVKDLEADFISKGALKELPSASGKQGSGNPTPNMRLTFAIWRIVVQISLLYVLIGFILARSKAVNRKISFSEILSYTAVGVGAFLLVCLVMVDIFIIMYLVLSKFLFMTYMILRSTYYVTDCDEKINLLRPSQLFCFTTKDLIFNWKTFCSPHVKVIFCVVATIFFSIYSVLVAHYGPSANKMSIPIHRLPLSMNGFRIAMVADLHIGPWLGKHNLEMVVDQINAEDADIVVIVGDLVDMSITNMQGAIEPVQRIKSKYGVYFVPGNHDFFTKDIDNWYKYLEERGVQVLDNKVQRVCLKESAEDCIYVVGTEDVSADNYEGHSFGLMSIMPEVNPNMATILLTHQPIGARKAVNSEFTFDLILSGHTHGGQWFPASIAVYLTNPYFQGLYHPKEKTYLYVTTGAWYWGIPMRFPYSPEIPVITLVSVDN